MSLPAITGLGGHHLIIGISFSHFYSLFLRFVKAVLLIFKHAMFLCHSSTTESALDLAGLDYQNIDMDLKIQDYLKASSPEQSVEDFASFIMATDIGMLIGASVIIIITNQSFSIISSARRRSLAGKTLRIS